MPQPIHRSLRSDCYQAIDQLRNLLWRRRSGLPVALAGSRVERRRPRRRLGVEVLEDRLPPGSMFNPLLGGAEDLERAALTAGLEAGSNGREVLARAQRGDEGLSLPAGLSLDIGVSLTPDHGAAYRPPAASEPSPFTPSLPARAGNDGLRSGLVEANLLLSDALLDDLLGFEQPSQPAALPESLTANPRPANSLTAADGGLGTGAGRLAGTPPSAAAGAVPAPRAHEEIPPLLLAGGTGGGASSGDDTHVWVEGEPKVDFPEGFPATTEFIFQRNGNLGSPLTASFTISGTATPGQDYEFLSGPIGGQVTFDVGEPQVALVWRPLEDQIAEGSETIVATVNPGSGYTAGHPLSGSPSWTVTISDDGDDLPLGTYRVQSGSTLQATLPSGEGKFPTFEQVSDPEHGTLTLNADGSFTYTPDGDYLGTDTFTYRIIDGVDDDEGATATIVIEPRELVLFLNYDVLSVLDECGCMAPEDPPVDPSNPFNLTPDDRAAFDAARAQWLLEIGPASVGPDVDSFGELQNYAGVAEAKLGQVQGHAATLLNMVAHPEDFTKEQYLAALAAGVRAYDEYLKAYQEAIIVQGQFIADVWWISSSDQALLERVNALPSRVTGITARLTPEQWNGVNSATRQVGQALGNMIDTLDTVHGALQGARNTVIIGGVAIAGVILLPATAALVIGGGLLAAGTALTAGARWNDGQSAAQIITGTAADLTGVGGIYMSITERDIATGQERVLTPYERGQLFGTGATQLFLTIGGLHAASGGGSTSARLQLPKPVLRPGLGIATAEGGLYSMPATLGWEWVTVGVSQPVLATSTVVGTLRVTAYMTGDPPPEGTHTVPHSRTAHDVGAQQGRQHAEEQLGLQETGWVNPYEDWGSYGQGIDDVMIDALGNYWIVEYKGGQAQLCGDQMQPTWVTRKLTELQQAQSPWWQILDQARTAGRLKGVAIHTEYENGVVGQTTVIGTWTY